jgi:CheY-like chemotaxis protein
VSARILCVDDEPNVLEGIERQMRKRYEISTAAGPDAALQKLTTDGPFAVVVSDLRMPRMSGNQLLAAVRIRFPDTVRVMLTGQADLADAMAAVNDGNVFQFLLKPCPSDSLVRAFDAALEQYRLVHAERVLLEETLRGSIGVMIEILGVVNPPAFGMAHRIRRYVQHMVSKLGLADTWQYEIAAMLSQIGCVAVPPEIIEKRRMALPLGQEEEEVLRAQNRIGKNLLAKIPRLETVAAIIDHQTASWPPLQGNPGTAYLGGHLVRIALDLEAKVARGLDPEAALREMSECKRYHPEFLMALNDFPFDVGGSQIKTIALAQLREGMILNADVHGRNGLLVLGKGLEVTSSVIARLQSFARTSGIAEPLSVIVPRTARASSV